MKSVRVWSFRNRKKQTAVNILWAIFRTCLLIGLFFVILYPILYMLSVTFRDTMDNFDSSVVWVPKHFTLVNLKTAYEAINYPATLGNTAFISILASVLTVASTAVTGYGFARFNFKGRNLLFGVVLFSIIIPAQTYVMPLYIEMRYFDWWGITKIFSLFSAEPITSNFINSRFSLFFPAAMASGIRSGLFIYIFRQFFRGMPKELEEAGYIDGCGFIKTFLRIMVPNVKPAFVTVFLLSMVWYWNDYHFSGMLLGKLRNLTMSLLSIESLMIAQSDIIPTANEIISVQQAGCLLVITPLVLMYCVSQRQFTQSIERTGIVG